MTIQRYRTSLPMYSIPRDEPILPGAADPLACEAIVSRWPYHAQALDLYLNKHELRPPEVVAIVDLDKNCTVERHSDVISRYGLVRGEQLPRYEDPQIQQLGALVDRPPALYVWFIVWTAQGAFAFQVGAIARRTKVEREMLAEREARERLIFDLEAPRREEARRIDEEIAARDLARRARKAPPPPPRKVVKPKPRAEIAYPPVNYTRRPAR